MTSRRSKAVRNDDCLRVCVAMLTGRPVSRVPHFVRKHRGRWDWHLRRWCDRCGYTFVMHSGSRGLRAWFGRRVRRWIEVGKTRDCDGHAIVLGHKGTVWDGGHPLRSSTTTIVILRGRC